MTHEIMLVSAPPVWERPSPETFDAKKSRFLDEEDDWQFKFIEQNSEDTVF